MKFPRVPLISLCAIVFVSVFLFAVVSPARAAEVRNRDTTISKDEYIDDDLFLFGDTITMEGIVTGDLVAVGGNVTISGQVSGNVYASGGEVVVSGTVGRSLFVGAGRVKLTGVVERSTYIGAGQVLVSSGAYVMEDLLAAGGQMDLDGWIGDDMLLSGGNIDVRAIVSDDLYASGGVVRATEDNVGGDFKVSASGDEATDLGWQGRQAASEIRSAARQSLLVGFLSKILWSAGLFLVGVLFIKFVPVKTADIVNKMSENFGEFMWSIVIGLLVSSAIPVAVIVLAVTVVGAPLSVLLAGLALFLVIFGAVWADIAVGQKVLTALGYSGKNMYAPLFAGRVLRLIVTLVPCVGALYGFVLSWAVVGAAVRMKFDRIEGSKATISMKSVVSIPADFKPTVRKPRRKVSRPSRSGATRRRTTRKKA